MRGDISMVMTSGSMPTSEPTRPSRWTTSEGTGAAHGAATDAGHRQLVALGQAASAASCGSRSRTAGRCRPGWNGRCSLAGQTVVRVPPKLMAGARHSRPNPGQVRPDRRVGHRPGRAARARPARRASTTSSASSGCWSTTARTWSPSAPGCMNRLRWHLHELEPDSTCPLAVSGPATANSTAYGPARRTAQHGPGGPAGRSWWPTSGRTLGSNDLEQEMAQRTRSDRPAAARAARLWGAHRREDPRGDRQV